MEDETNIPIKPEKNSIEDHIARATQAADGPSTPELVNVSIAHSLLAFVMMMQEARLEDK